MREYYIVAFYCFVDIADPHEEVKKQKDFLKNLDVRCRIYVAHNGINAQMSLMKEDALKYIEWLTEDSRFKKINFQIDPYHEHVLEKVIVKFRNQLVALDYKPNLELTGEHVSPHNWQEMLHNRDENTCLIDVRNSYESTIGHFEGAEKPPLESFRDFYKYAEELKKEKDPEKTKVMMYCTGGIRCELYSALLKEKGFKHVYQLEGGVIHYGHKVGNKYWKGTLFVFDDRLSTSISEDQHELISYCYQCKACCDTYYNCANMDCNALFLSCVECAEKMKGCCCSDCIEAPRVRSFEKTDDPKPFRKWYHYSDIKK